MNKLEKLRELLKISTENVSFNHWTPAIHEDKHEALAEQIVKLFDVPDVSVSFLDELQMKVNYHMNSENDRASVKNYRDAIYHSTCAGAVADVILMAKRKNED